MRAGYTDKISIIVPIYNSESYLNASVGSLVEQRYRNIEIILIDDCSYDNSISIAQNIASKDSRVKLVLQKRNQGVSAARNIGIDIATGSYIAFLDSDDFWLPSKLEEQLDFMKKHHSAISCTGYSVVDEKNRYIGGLIPPAKATYTDLLKRNTIGCSTVMYNVSMIGKKKFPDCGHEDYALWLSILKENREIDGLKKKLSSYTKRRGSVSSDKMKVIKFFWYIYHIREEFSLLKSACYIAQYALLNKGKYKIVKYTKAT
ncbi:MAG: glycosyltransferase family 2 protein [Candidatus Electrothrix sp. AX2]|nr:glycosyltransferase family 2 protein [Candidatus Electrothrix gigas]